MPTTAELLQQRANIWSQMTEVMDLASSENRDLTAEETTKYDKAEADLDSLEDTIARQQRHEARAKESKKVDRSELDPNNRNGGDDVKPAAKYKNAFDQWMKFGSADMDRDEKAVLQAGFVNPKEVQNAAGVSTGGAGGYTVPPEYRNAIIERMQFISSVRAVADHIESDSGATLPWPTVDDTGSIGAILGENVQVTEQDATFGTNQLNAYMYTSKLSRVSLQLLQDTGFDLEGWLKKTQATRIARIQNQHFTTGTGTSQPLGIVTGASVGKTGAAGQTTSITYEDLIDMTESLDPAYLGDGSTTRFMMAQSMRKFIRKLKDGQNRPLWEPSVQLGAPDILLGHGMVLNNNMPAPAASAKSLMFGDFREAYVVRDVKDFFLVRFAERYMDYLQVGFAGFQRSDGTVQNQYAYSAYQHPAT